MLNEQEITTKELRANLADILHRVSVLRETIYITNRGRRVAIIHPAVPSQDIPEVSRPSGLA